MIKGAMIGAALAALMAAPAAADFSVCNKSDASAYVAIGYKSDGQWVSEGWWSVAVGECSTLIVGDLKNKFYYLRGESDTGFWTGDYNFCYVQDEFTIYGDENCNDRGYKTGGFFEVDTGDSRDWTQNLTE